MELLVLYTSFFGSWLVVGGSIYQAALELRDQDLERDRIRLAATKIKEPPKVSAWWWLVPPVKIYLEHRRTDQYRAAHIAALDKQDAEALVEYISKATGWLYVALGGLLISLKETYELIEHYEKGSLFFMVLVVFMLGIALSNTVFQIKRSEKLLS